MVYGVGSAVRFDEYGSLEISPVQRSTGVSQAPEGLGAGQPIGVHGTNEDHRLLGTDGDEEWRGRRRVAAVVGHLQDLGIEVRLAGVWWSAGIRGCSATQLPCRYSKTFNSGCVAASSTTDPLTANPRARLLPLTVSSRSPGRTWYSLNVSKGRVM